MHLVIIDGTKFYQRDRERARKRVLSHTIPGSGKWRFWCVSKHAGATCAWRGVDCEWPVEDHPGWASSDENGMVCCTLHKKGWQCKGKAIIPSLPKCGCHNNPSVGKTPRNSRGWRSPIHSSGSSRPMVWWLGSNRKKIHDNHNNNNHNSSGDQGDEMCN